MNSTMKNIEKELLWSNAIGKAARLYGGRYGIIREVNFIDQTIQVFTGIEDDFHIIEMKYLLPINNGTFVEVDDDYLNIVEILGIFNE